MENRKSIARQGSIWINDGKAVKSIKADQWPEFEILGWVRGRLLDTSPAKKGSARFRKNRIYVTNGRKCFLIPKVDFPKWQAEGFERGRIVRSMTAKRGNETKKISVFELLDHLENGWKIISKRG